MVAALVSLFLIFLFFSFLTLGSCGWSPGLSAAGRQFPALLGDKLGAQEGRGSPAPESRARGWRLGAGKKGGGLSLEGGKLVRLLGTGPTEGPSGERRSGAGRGGGLLGTGRGRRALPYRCHHKVEGSQLWSRA